MTCSLFLVAMSSPSASPRWVTGLTKVRLWTWLLMGANAAFVFMMVQALRAGSAQGWCTETYGQAPRCGDREVGAIVGPGWLLFAWVVVDVVLGVIWWYSRPKVTD